MRNRLSRLVLLLWIGAVVLAGLIFSYILSLRPGLPAEEPALPIPSSTLTVTPTVTPTSAPSKTTPLPTTTSASIPPSLTPFSKEPVVIGTSVAGLPLEVYQFGSGPIEKMIAAGIHGGYEFNTIILADELIEYLSRHPEIVPPDQTLYILRALNPDGFERSRGFGGRANENNVDLNRNFPSNWQAEWPREGCWDYIPITGGESAASEPETQALITFINQHDIQALISYHSAALGIFPGGQPPDSGSLSLAEALAGVSDYPYPPIDAGCVFTGQLVDWASDSGIPAVDIELSNHQDSDFEINLGVLSVFLDWTPPNN
jgi:hypothetical protein